MFHYLNKFEINYLSNKNYINYIMLEGKKVNNSPIIKISDNDEYFHGFKYENILKLDFRTSIGRKLLKDCNLSSSQLKKMVYKKLSSKKTILKKENDYNHSDIKNDLNIDLLNGNIKNVSILKKYSYQQLKHLSKYLNKNYQMRKDSLCDVLIDYVVRFNDILNFKDQIIILQSLIRKKNILFRNFYKGPAYLRRNISVNDSDFYTCDNINDIPDDYFFSYKDDDNFIYSYDIRSFRELIYNKSLNPYTNCEIPDRILDLFNQRIKQMAILKINIEEYKDEIELTEEQKFNQKVLEIFQKINKLGHYSHLEWFTGLSSKRLKIWYKEAEDIFNYRAQLSELDKKKIVPNGKAFKMRVSDFYKIPDLNKKKLQLLVLNEIDLLISSGISDSDKYTGSLYVLTAFTIVSSQAAIALPWLCQYE